MDKSAKTWRGNFYSYCCPHQVGNLKVLWDTLIGLRCYSFKVASIRSLGEYEQVPLSQKLLFLKSTDMVPIGKYERRNIHA